MVGVRGNTTAKFKHRPAIAWMQRRNLRGTMDIFASLPAYLDSVFGENGKIALQILKIIGINIVLSGDNAVVIALACRGLPPKQRMVGILLGAGAAVILRIIFTVVIQQLLGIPYLKLVGGLLLFWVAIKLVMSEEADEDSIKAGGSLWEAVKIVAIADVVMSLDNVLAIAAAAGGETWLIILGLIISIPMVVAGATLIMALLTRFPILVWAGAALLGWVAGELLATEPAIAPYLHQAAAAIGITDKLMHTALEIGGAVFVVLMGLLLTAGSHKKHEAKPQA
jgi:YjbE family integral membrane protein